MSKDFQSLRLASVSIDMDEVGCYSSIHGLQPPSASAANAIYDKAIPRYETFLNELGIHATFFAIGSDLGREENRATLRRLSRAGHEIGNHSWHHHYDFCRHSPESIAAEIRGGADAIEVATGNRPVGFRAPGYTITDAVFRELQTQNYEYDSSVFPCPAYFGAKTAAIGAIQLRGRQSRSIVDTPNVLRASADPYHIGQPYWKRGNGMLELPIGVTRKLRLPYIGTSIALGGKLIAKALTQQIIGRPFVNLELHGIDLSDADDDGLTFLKQHQPDLRVTAKKKRAALEVAINALRSAGYRFVTMHEAAKLLG